ncbi:unnamed protein product [Rhizophagus irregularis]|uniref:Uncharacterized protein n=1 Tax=Rhizophagus irregularis TaxID=588596 RepID=A0A915Z478_9GLOM|nr:unnamed protein product [Rhizophagus irregularis]
MEIPPEFFDEIKHQIQSIGTKGGYKIIPCYGITKDPATEDFMMPENRPTSHDLKYQIGSSPPTSEITYTTHPQAIYKSRLLPLLPNHPSQFENADSRLIDLEIPDL